LVQLVELQIFVCNSVLFCLAGALLMTESAAAAGVDDVVAAKAAASEGVTSMTDRVTIIPNLKFSWQSATMSHHSLLSILPINDV